ncbi:MAG TPA: biotin transporter BioY [Candidatus Eisenbacteria bacterium]|nr:biotin transporter BioY [Candidatus Eisenbacteria bacterium]
MARIVVRTHATVGEQSLNLAKQAGVVIGASAVIAVCARLVLPLPFTPVPLTLANFGVLLVGLALGSKRGFAAAALYLAWGAVGLPVFSPSGAGGIAQLFGPTGGYLLAYPVAAFVAGWIAEQSEVSFRRNVLASVLAEFVLFGGGLAGLAVVTGDWRRAVAFGLAPFFFAEIIKVMMASAAACRIQRTL